MPTIILDRVRVADGRRAAFCGRLPIALCAGPPRPCVGGRPPSRYVDPSFGAELPRRRAGPSQWRGAAPPRRAEPLPLCPLLNMEVVSGSALSARRQRSRADPQYPRSAPLIAGAPRLFREVGVPVIHALDPAYHVPHDALGHVRPHAGARHQRTCSSAKIVNYPGAREGSAASNRALAWPVP